MAVCSSVVKTVVPDYSNGDCVKLCSEHYWPPKDENNQVYRHLPPTTDTVLTKPFPIRGKLFLHIFLTYNSLYLLCRIALKLIIRY